MEDITVDRFLEAFFEIMPRLAEDFEIQKQDIKNQYSEDPGKQLEIIREVFFDLFRKYEPELIRSFDMSFSAFNEYAAVYRDIINRELEKDPERKKEYQTILEKLRLVS